MILKIVHENSIVKSNYIQEISALSDNHNGYFGV